MSADLRERLEFKLRAERAGLRIHVSRQPTPWEAARPRMPAIRLRPGWLAFLARHGAPDFLVDWGDHWCRTGDHSPEFSAWERDLAAWEASRPNDEDAQVAEREAEFQRVEAEVRAATDNPAPREA